MRPNHRLRPPLVLGALLVAASLGIAACGGDDDGGSAATTVASNCKPAHEFSTIEKGTLTVSAYSYPPSTVVEDGDLKGLEGELLHQIAKKECLKLKVLSQAGPGVIPAVQSGRADLAAGGWYRTKERSKLVNLSAPIFKDQIVIVSRNGEIKSVDDLVGKQVGSTEGNLFNEDVTKLLGDNFKTYQTTLDAYQDLGNGRLDAVIDGGSGAIESIKKLPNTNFKAVAPPPDDRVEATTAPGQINWPGTKGNDALTKAINEDIAALRDQGEIDRLLKQYGFPPESGDVGRPSLL